MGGETRELVITQCFTSLSDLNQIVGLIYQQQKTEAVVVEVDN